MSNSSDATVGFSFDILYLFILVLEFSQLSRELTGETEFRLYK